MGNLCCIEHPKQQGTQEELQIAQLQWLNFEDVDDNTYLFKKAKVLKVYDGDTFWIAAWHDNRVQKFKVRLYGIDTSEMTDENKEEHLRAQKAKEFLEYKILNQIIDIDVMNNRIYVNPETGRNKKMSEKFGRLLATVKLNGLDIAEEIIKLGLADKYYGGKKNRKKQIEDADD